MKKYLRLFLALVLPFLAVSAALTVIGLPTAFTAFAASVQSGRFYQEVTTSASYVQVTHGTPAVDGIGFVTGYISVKNTSSNSALISFDGTNTHATIAGNERREFTLRREETLYYKNGAGAATLQIEAW